MNEENAQVIYDLLDRIKVTDENRERMEKIRNAASPIRTATYMDVLSTLPFFVCETCSFTVMSSISQNSHPDIVLLRKFQYHPVYVLHLRTFH